MSDDFWGEPIYSYTRAQAIEDGELINVDRPLLAEAGIKIPLVLTRAAWNRYVEFSPEDGDGQSEIGRLWDVLWMFRMAAARQPASEIQFQLYVAKADRGDWLPNEKPPERDASFTRETHRLVTLKALCHPGDNMEPVITIMLPDED